MKELVDRMAQALVDYPEQVVVTEVRGDRTIVMELKVAKDDISKIIGKQGRNAFAMRTILNAASAKAGMHVLLEIIEDFDDTDDRSFSSSSGRDDETATGSSTGIVKWFDGRKGYGFIETDEGGDVFVHRNDIIGSGFKSLEEGARVTFDVEKDAKGQKAVKVLKA